MNRNNFKNIRTYKGRNFFRINSYQKTYKNAKLYRLDYKYSNQLNRAV